MDKLVLIDGNSIAFRAFYALPLLTNGKGVHTNAVYGFTMMLMKVLEEEKPTHMLVAFDAGRITFRHGEYREYKGKRAQTPAELSEQLPLIREVLDAFGIRHFEAEGYEADDIIGTLAKSAEEKGMNALIVTGDKDLLQLVTDRVTLLLTRKGVTEGERYDREAVWQKYQLTPEQIIDLKGLMGDASDNIPGIPGVGGEDRPQAFAPVRVRRRGVGPCGPIDRKAAGAGEGTRPTGTDEQGFGHHLLRRSPRFFRGGYPLRGI